MSEENVSENYIMLQNTSNYTYLGDNNLESLYMFYIPPMLLFCLASIIINFRVLLAVHWIRRPLSPTLHISLSLAAADACTSALLGLGLLLNSYLPKVYGIEIASCLALLTIEMYRLSGVIITVMHLLALSINHYLGILKPLHYISIMTTRKTTITVILLWIIPIAFIKTYFFTVSDDDFWEVGCVTLSFLSEIKFRIVFSSLFFVPLILMIFCYTHILLLVRKQQKIWSQLSRSGSTRYRGVRTNRHGINSQQRQMEGNVKAIYTTLFILGSCVVGWLPAVITYLIICPKGCLYSGKELERIRTENIHMFFYISWFTNVLIILKTLANPIIYSCRMIEIKEGTRKMHTALSRTWRGSQRTEERHMSGSQRSQQAFGGAMRVGMTSLCRLNGNISHRSIRRSELDNTLL
ncbi:beta-2 adrenergic receptor-like [Photinus pyralis]|uniref:beta-2 adrenergic receptor-like n=1 Tax=Photinus pyralis TaxID=7054 RepID=UPI0012672036|nr:beta-2 adrenergic receptor-like [Photinus pyralis]